MIDFSNGRFTLDEEEPQRVFKVGGGVALDQTKSMSLDRGLLSRYLF